jgi:diaminopimelate epimerase
VSDRLEVAKYQASGNDFLLVDERGGAPSALDVPSLCDRWFGVGADGLIRVRTGERARYAFDLTNADGSPAAMSGNGMRCLAAFLRDRGDAVLGDVLEVETPAGLRRVTLTDGGATVEMGAPNFTLAAIPMRGPAWETFLDQPWDLGGGLTLRASALSMGNPHLVLFTEEEPARYHLEHLGPAIEHDGRFPERTNVEFARVVDRATIDVRVWERGVGETLACGTGACAVAVAASEGGLVDGVVTVRFRGGPLTVERRADGQVLLGGPVAHVFDATLDPGALA